METLQSIKQVVANPLRTWRAKYLKDSVCSMTLIRQANDVVRAENRIHAG